MPKTKFEWKYKDCNRVWWQIHVSRGVLSQDRLGDKHYEWDYEIFREEVGGLDRVHSGFILGQYDIEPKPVDIMLDFLNYINNVVVGVCMYCER